MLITVINKLINISPLSFHPVKTTKIYNLSDNHFFLSIAPAWFIIFYICLCKHKKKIMSFPNGQAGCGLVAAIILQGRNTPIWNIGSSYHSSCCPYQRKHIKFGLHSFGVIKTIFRFVYTADNKYHPLGSSSILYLLSSSYLQVICNILRVRQNTSYE